MKTTKTYIDGYDKFENIDDFKFSLIHGREIIIEWADIEYTILNEGENNDRFSVCEANKPETEIIFNSVDELLECTLKAGKKLKDIITQAQVNWRNL